MLKKLHVLILFPVLLFSNLNSMENTKQKTRLDEEKSEEHIVPEQSFEVEDELKDIKKESKKPKDDEKVIYTFGKGKNKVGFSLKNRTEAFYSRSLQLLSPSPLDQVVYVQHTWDLKTDASFGDTIKSLIVIRHKDRWGNPNSIAGTTTETIKIADAVVGAHNHFVGKQLFWLREGWVDIFLNDALFNCRRFFF
jgi:hypothetical protein